MDINPIVPALAVSALVESWLLVYAWRRRAYSVAVSFGLMMVCLLIWTLGYILELSDQDLEGALFWANVQFLGITFLPLVWLAMVVDYTGRWQRWRPFLGWALVIPMVTNLVIWTNSYHHLFRGTPILVTSGSFPVLNSDYGPWFYFPTATVGYFFFCVGFVLLVQAYRSGRVPFRRQIVGVGLTTLFPLVVDVLFVLGVSPIAHVNFTLPVFAGSGMFLAWMLFSSRLLELNPVARSTVLDIMSDVFFVVDANNRIVDMNPAALALIPQTEREVIGKSVLEIFSQRLDLVNRFLQAEQAQAEVYLDLEDGRHWYDMRLWPIYDRRRLTGRLLIMRDITELWQAKHNLEALAGQLEERVAQRTQELADANERLRELDYMKDEFISRISHELRTPLANVKIYLHLLDKAKPEKQATYRSTLMQQTNQLQRLIEDLLAVSYFSRNQGEVNLTAVDLTSLLADLVQDHGSRISESAITLELAVAADLPPVLGERGMVRQAVANLLLNACHYAPRSRVTLGADLQRRDGEPWVQIWVQDQGMGLSEEDQRRLFERFYRGRAAANYDVPGVGLGLSLAQTIMAQIQGEITWESMPGQGATFLLWLRPVPD